MLTLTADEQAILSGVNGATADRLALQLVADAARILGADKLVPIVSSHIDGCLYHGDSGVLYCERLAASGGQVKVPTTTNVGALNLLKPEQVRVPKERRAMAARLMTAHTQMGCQPTWTCAPYQAGARPALGTQVAWGESNAVAFVNTVLGARTNRYGDFLDIACALTARAPYYSLHCTENRRAKLLLDVSKLSERLKREDAFYPVLGALIGREAGDAVCAVDGLAVEPTEDQLKALCAAAAATGAVALIHIVGVTPEADNLEAALQGGRPDATLTVHADMIDAARRSLGLSNSETVDCVALGSPHFSRNECRQLLRLANGRSFRTPVYVCLGRHTLTDLESDGTREALTDLGVEFVVDTCVVVTPILPKGKGVMMTNSGKFAHYAMGNTGYEPQFGALSECVESAIAGRVMTNPEIWS